MKKKKTSAGYKRFMVNMEPELHRQAQALAHAGNRSFSGLCRSLLAVALQAEKKEDKQ